MILNEYFSLFLGGGVVISRTTGCQMEERERNRKNKKRKKNKKNGQAVIVCVNWK